MISRPSSGDVIHLQRLMQSPPVRRFVNGPKYKSTAQLSSELRAAGNSDFQPLVLHGRHRGEFLGSVGFLNWNHEPSSAEIYCFLTPFAWGRGLAREALDALISNAFKNTRVVGIFGVVSPRNLKSQRLVRALGMSFRGVLSKAENWQNGHYVFSITRSEHSYACKRTSGRDFLFPDSRSYRGRLTRR